MKKFAFLAFITVCALPLRAEDKKQAPQPLTLDQLYRIKGELVTQKEITDAQLAQVNQAIAEALAQRQKEKK